ncbi:MAG: AAA family ATPase [Tannerellaceae bacterium]|nr:AAA family ATPase [Tannerellaceae bacterium]
MKESIVIRNFGPIRCVEISDIKPFIVFIGGSGSGKSTILKVLALFRWIYKMHNIRSYLKHANVSQSLFNLDFRQYLKNNGFTNYLKSDTEIIYQRGNIKVVYKEKLMASQLVSKEELSLEKVSFICDKRNLIPDILAERRPDKRPMSFFLWDTFEDFITSSKLINELNIDYLGVKYLSKETSLGTKHFIEGINKAGNYTIDLEDSSSGTQMVVPLAVIVEYFSKYYDFNSAVNTMIWWYLSQGDNLKDFRTDLNIGDIRHRRVHIHIEEPELSLDPESQLSLISFIVNRCLIEKHSDYDMTLMLTTHSPYIINYLNLLIRAYDTNTPVKGAKLSFDDMSVYQVADGEIIDLKVQNKRLIYTDPLSDPINRIYDEYNLLPE